MLIEFSLRGSIVTPAVYPRLIEFLHFDVQSNGIAPAPRRRKSGDGSLMLHTKFQGHQSFGSGEEDFKGFYNIQVVTFFDLDRLYSKVNMLYKRSRSMGTCRNKRFHGTF